MSYNPKKLWCSRVSDINHDLVSGAITLTVWDRGKAYRFEMDDLLKSGLHVSYKLDAWINEFITPDFKWDLKLIRDFGENPDFDGRHMVKS